MEKSQSTLKDEHNAKYAYDLCHHLFPSLDHRSKEIQVVDISVKYSRRSFTSIVPYSVVQIWFTYNESQIGDHPKEWEKYCLDHGYEYKLWTHP